MVLITVWKRPFYTVISTILPYNQHPFATTKWCNKYSCNRYFWPFPCDISIKFVYLQINSIYAEHLDRRTMLLRCRSTMDSDKDKQNILTLRKGGKQTDISTERPRNNDGRKTAFRSCLLQSCRNHAANKKKKKSVPTLFLKITYWAFSSCSLIYEYRQYSLPRTSGLEVHARKAWTILCLLEIRSLGGTY